MPVLEFDDENEEPDRVAKFSTRGENPIGTVHDSKSEKTPRSARSAAAMKIAGATYEEIAQVLDYVNASAARSAVEQVLAETTDETQDYRALRALANRRLDGLLKAAYPKAIDKDSPEQLAYMQKSLQIIDRQAKLNGIDAPQVISLVTPTAEEFDKVVQQLVQVKGAPAAPEADIFQLEQGPDGETWGAEDDDGA